VAGVVAIHAELAAYQDELARRPRLVVLNRVDLRGEDDPVDLARELAAALEALGDAPAAVDLVRDDATGAPLVLPVSCATGIGVAELVGALARIVPEPEPTPEAEPELPQYLVYRPGRSGGAQVRVLRDEQGVRIVGCPIEDRLQGLDDAGAEHELAAWVEERRLSPLLVRAGARKGIVVRLGEREIPFRA
jgi:hypothetical protein